MVTNSTRLVNTIKLWRSITKPLEEIIQTLISTKIELLAILTYGNLQARNNYSKECKHPVGQENIKLETTTRKFLIRLASLIRQRRSGKKVNIKLIQLQEAGKSTNHQPQKFPPQDFVRINNPNF
jgi:uncharacterized protein YaeQ